MKKTAIIIVVSILLFFRNIGLADILHVPSQYSTIQSAIDDANDGDTVIVADGTYTGPGNRDIDFLGKAITVHSENGPNTCIIDCEDSAGGFRFRNDEDANSVLNGFTIANGYTGIFCGHSSWAITNCGSPTITNCIIMNNTDSGIQCVDGSSPTITNCNIIGNSVGHGGGIFSWESSPTITNCIISGNTADYGGGIYCEESNLTITSCTIAGNTADRYGGGILCGTSTLSMTNSILWDNTAQDGAGMYASHSIVNVTYSDIQGGFIGESNIDIDPLLTPDGHLQTGSPCIDAGNPDFLPEPGETDIDGQPRIMAGRLDMGADETDGPLSSAIVLSSRDLCFYADEGGSSPATQILSIRNILPDSLNWEITEDCPWLYIYPLTGSSTDEPNDVIVYASSIGLTSGIYNCSFTVSEPNAANSPRTVTVTLCIFDPEMLIVPAEYPTIQSAIDAAADGDTVVVAPGTYTGYGNYDISFLGKAITVRSIDPNDPLIVADTIVNCADLGPEHDGFNFRNEEDANSVLNGFTITNSEYYAIDGYNSSPAIKNCVITGNNGRFDGAIYFVYGNPTITNCTVSDNSSSGIYYHGYCDYYGQDCTTMTVKNCTITGNTGWGRMTNGGGISVFRGLCLIYNSIISGHNVDEGGGGILCGWSGGKVEINNSIIAGNTAGEYGGGICCTDNGQAKIRNCTIADNSAGLNGGGIFFDSDSSASINSSILWGNSDSTGTGQSAQIYDDSGSPKVWFSCIRDDNPDDANVPFGEEQFNIDDDPCLTADYHLLANSPCIETGDPYLTYHPGDTDIDDQPRRMGLNVDIGADEFELSAIVVTKPKGGEVWTAGSTHQINWDSYDIAGTIDIFYSDNNGIDWVMIDNAPDTGNYTWNLPPAVDSNQCIVAVEPNVIPPNLICIESNPFTIQPYFSPPPGHGWPGNPQMKSGPRYGCVKWKFQSDGPVTAGVAVGHNRLYVPSEDGKLYTLNPAGELLWTYDTNSPLVGSPAVTRNGSVYVGAENGVLYAIGKWGQLLWTHTTDGPIYSSPAISADGDIYIGSLDGKLHALAQDGSELWTFQTDGISPVAEGSIFASPAIDTNGTVYIAGVYDPNLYALDSNDGTVKWSRTFLHPCTTFSTHRRTWPLASPVIAQDGTIYQTLLYDPNLYAVDPNDGSVIWSANLADPCSGWFEPNYINQHTFWSESHYPSPYNRYASSWSKPALAPDGTIYVSFDDPYLRAVDPNGTIKWVTRLGMMGGFTMTVGGDGLIYAACDDGYLYVVDPNGREISRFQGNSGLTFPKITTGHTVIVSDADNAVWAISQYDCWPQQPLALHRPEDLNGDRTVNITDFAILAAGWLDRTRCCYHERTDSCWPCSFEEEHVYPEGDIDKSLNTDFDDLAQLANQWLN